MAIRLRYIKDSVIALCAAKSKELPGDIYLNDAIHHALSTKFALDWHSEGILPDNSLTDPQLIPLIKQEET